jgi:hypothetical protein
MILIVYIKILKDTMSIAWFAILYLHAGWRVPAGAEPGEMDR